GAQEPAERQRQGEDLRETEVDGKHGAEGGTAGDAEQRRFGEGIAQRALRGGPGQTERGADEGAESGTRQADFPEDEPAGLPRVRPAETGGADGEREHESDERQRAQTHEQPDREGLSAGRRHGRLPSSVLRAAASFSTASAICVVPHSQSCHGSSREARSRSKRTRAGWRRLSAAAVGESSPRLASKKRSGRA